MGIVSLPTTFVDGTTPTAAQFNGDFSALLNEFNGSIDNSNIKAAAAIAYSKLNLTGSIVAADFAAGVSGADGWSAISATLAYSSADGHTFVVTATADLTASIQAGDRMKFTNNGTTFFGIVTAIAAGSITLYGGTQYTVANAAITNAYYSHMKSPFGFNVDPSIWMEELSDTTDRTQAPSGATWYNLGTLSLAIPIGKWRVEYFIVGYILISASGASSMFATLSTTNSSESDIDFTTAIAGPANGQPGIGVMTKAKYLTLAAKTPYFVNAKADNSPTSINFRNSSTGGKMFVRAICAYL